VQLNPQQKQSLALARTLLSEMVEGRKTSGTA